MTNATRRNFFLKAGTALSLPFGAGASIAEDARLAALNDLRSIRQLQQALAREINHATGREAALFTDNKLPAQLADVTRLLPADFGEHDVIETARDGRTARAILHCAIETQVPIAAEGTLIEMARAQGEGFVRFTARQIIELACVRERGTWKIKTLALREV